VHSQSLLFSKALVNEILGYANSRGLDLPMSTGRDLVARILVDKPYAQAMAALKAGKLMPASFDETRNGRLQVDFPNSALAIDQLSPIVQHFVLWADDRLRLLSTITKAVAEGRIPAPPHLSLDTVDEFLARQSLSKTDVEIVPDHQFTLYRGKHLSFVRHRGWWYLKYDCLFEDSSGKISGLFSADVCGMTVFGGGSLRDHCALCWVFDNGRWDLHWEVHRVAEESELDLTFDQFVNSA